MATKATRRLTSQPNRWLLAQCVFVCTMLAVWGCLPPECPGPDSGLGVPAKQKTPVKAQQADNSECLICHMDFKTELLSIKHERAGVGCISCHGTSLPHGDDELNITPPDRLFGRAEVVPFCKACHPTHKTGKVYKVFFRKWHGRRRPNGRMVLDDSVCTDCHGNHAVLRVDQQQLMSE